MHYAARAAILGKSNHEMFNFGNWFLCQFSSNTWFFLDEALLTSQKLENEKVKFQISVSGGVQLEKREGGVFHG